MPVPLEDLRAHPPRLVRQGSLAQRALDLLQSTPGEAWRPVEIAHRLDVEQTTLSPALTRLHRRGLVEREQGHWYALADHEVARRQAALFGNAMANERLGRENPDDWPSIERE